MPDVREVARLRISEAVDGTKKPKARAAETRPRAQVTHEVTVDPRVMAAAHEAIRPGQRLVIVSETEVRLVNK